MSELPEETTDPVAGQRVSAELAVTEQGVSGLTDTQIRQKVQQLQYVLNHGHAAMGCLLHTVMKGGLWKAWGYQDFEHYLDSEVHIKIRTAKYHMGTWKKFTDAKVAVEDLDALEWTKARTIAPILTEENKDEWIKNAQDKTVEQLENDVREYRAEQRGEPGGDSGFTTFTVRLQGEQIGNVEMALETASKASDSDAPNHLLDLICLSYNAQTGATKSLSWWVTHLEDSFGVILVDTVLERKEAMRRLAVESKE